MTGPGRARRVALPVAACTLAAVLVVFAVQALHGRDGRPNLVLIVWDTCRGDRVAVNGYGPPTTPRLARFAAGAVTFRRAYTPAPWTAPAHASLFTGVLPRDHQLREGMGDRVRPGLPLLARTLSEAGYETVSVSANPVVSTLTGLTRGFEHDFQHFRVPGGGVAGEAVAGQVRSWAVRRRAVRGDRRPVFLFVNLMETHLPYVFDGDAVGALHGPGAVPAAERASREVDDLDAKLHLAGGRRIPDETIASLSRAYDGAVHRVDAITGEILDVLEAEGLLDGALVAVCGDHGENLGEHGELNHALSVHDPVLHVPMVVRWPGRLDDGRVVDEQVRLHDLYATVMEAAGLDAPPGCGTDSVSLAAAPLLPRTVIAEYGPMARTQDEARGAMPDAPEAAFMPFRYLFRAVQEPDDGSRWLKHIVVVDGEADDGPAVVRERLFDLRADPGERRDLLGPDGTAEDRVVADRLRKVGEGGPGTSERPGQGRSAGD